MVGISGDIIGEAVWDFDLFVSEVVVVGDEIIAYVDISASRDAAANYIFLIRDSGIL
jgi:hypothetical protein